MEVKFAKIISIIFQPLMMPLLTLLILFNSTTTTAYYTDASDSFANGPTMAMSGVGLGAFSVEIP